jgi:hypothetical protein
VRDLKSRYVLGYPVAGAIFLGATASALAANDKPPTVELLDPNTTVSAALSNASNCQIITDHGKQYRVCPNFVQPEILNIIKSQQK